MPTYFNQLVRAILATYSGGYNAGSVIVAPSNNPSVVSISSATSTEGTSLIHTVTLATAVTSAPASYSISFSSVTASTPSDYSVTPTFSGGVTRSGNTLSVPIGSSSFTITVPTVQDTIYEGTETYTITVGGLSNTGTITDNDSIPTITSVSSASADEGTNIVHTVSITGTAQAAITFALSLSGGSATGGGTDYTSTLVNGNFSAGVTISAGTITVPSGITSFTVSVPTSTDALTEGNETYTLTVGGASGTGTVNDVVAESSEFFTGKISNLSANVIAGTLSAQMTITQSTGYTELATAVAAAMAGFSFTGQGSSINVVVSANRQTGVAPLGVHFDCSGTTAGGLTAIPFHELYYVTHFGDDDSATFSYGTRPGVAKKNIGIGPIAAHCFETGGVTRTTKTTAFHLSAGGVLSIGATVTKTIIIDDPDVVYAGTNTICLSTDGVFTGAPAGAATATVTTLAGISTYLTTSNRRVLLKRGNTFDSDGSTNYLTSTNITLGAFGTGAKPKIRHTGGVGDFWGPISFGTGSSNWKVMDLEYDGQATNPSDSHIKFLGAQEGTGQFGTFLRLNCHHFGGFMAMMDDCLMVDCNLDNLVGGGGNVGVWVGQQSRFGLLGTSINDSTNVEMNVRIQGGKKFVIAHNLLKDPMSNGEKHALSVRGWSFPFNGVDYTEQFVVSDNDISGFSYAVVHFEAQNTSSDERLRNGVFERNRIKGSGINQQMVASVSNDFTIRNNVFDMTLGTGTAISVGPSPFMSPQSTYVYNNSAYCSGDTFVFIGVNGNPSFHAAGTLVKNNVAYAPNAVMNEADVPFPQFSYIATESISTTTEINNSSTFQIKSTAPGFTLPPTTLAHWAPSTYPVNTGVYQAGLYDDVTGAIRTGITDRGAVAV